MDQYKCPKCGTENLNVLAEVWGLLRQEPLVNAMGVDLIEGEDPEFDDNSTMTCNACGESSAAKCFLVRPDLGVSDATMRFILAEIKLGRPIGRDLNPGTMVGLIEHNLTEGAFEQLCGSRDMATAKAELEGLAERLGWDYDLTYLADLEVPHG